MFEFFRRKRNNPTPENPHQVLLNRIKQIRVERIWRIFSHDTSTFAVRASFRTIQEYNYFLKQLLDGIKSPKELNQFLFRNSPEIVLLRDWYVDREGSYLDPIAHTNFFIEHSLSLVEEYSKLELIEKPDSIVSKKLLYIGPMITQISEIVKQLVEITKPEVVEESAIKPHY